MCALQAPDAAVPPTLLPSQLPIAAPAAIAIAPVRSPQQRLQDCPLLPLMRPPSAKHQQHCCSLFPLLLFLYKRMQQCKVLCRQLWLQLHQSQSQLQQLCWVLEFTALLLSSPTVIRYRLPEFRTHTVCTCGYGKLLAATMTAVRFGSNTCNALAACW